MFTFSITCLLWLNLLSTTLVSSNDCGYPNAEIWQNWFPTIEPPNTRVVYPTNDAELFQIVSTAISNGCIIRPSGTGHSGDGIVTQKLENNVLVVNLADYIPPNDWNGVIDTTKPSIKISGGNTWLDLISIIRPQGYLLHTQTAGFNFQIGGVLMNPGVHGATRDKGRMNNDIVSLRVLTYDGNIASIDIIDDEIEVTKWRGSMGLLGIVLGAEVSVRNDQGLFMDIDERFITNWNEASLEDLFDFVINSDSTQTFYNPYDDKFITLRATFGPSNYSNDLFDPLSTTSIYDQLLLDNPDLARTGSLLDDGTNILLQFFAGLDGLLTKFIGQTATALSEIVTINSWQSNFENQRDLYWVDFVPTYSGVAYFVPWNNRFQAIDQIRTLLKGIIDTPGEDWYPQIPILFRIVDIDQDKSLFENTATGRYLSIELQSISKVFGDVNDYNGILSVIEQIWIDLGGYPHIGKEWGYDFLDSLPVPYPWINTEGRLLYEGNQADAIVDALEEYDPTGLFRGGGALRLLGDAFNAPIESNYEPRSISGETCSIYDNAQCTTNCCCNNWWECNGEYKQCVENNVLEYGKQCDVDCECQTNNCRINFWVHRDLKKRCT